MTGFVQPCAAPHGKGCHFMLCQGHQQGGDVGRSDCALGRSHKGAARPTPASWRLFVPPTLLGLRKRSRGRRGPAGGTGLQSSAGDRPPAPIGPIVPGNCGRLRGFCGSYNLHFILWIYTCFVHFLLFPRSYFWWKCFF